MRKKLAISKVLRNCIFRLHLCKLGAKMVIERGGKEMNEQKQMQIKRLQKLAETLLNARLAADLTAVELAERAGVTTSTITRLEKAQIAQPTVETLRAVADALRLQVSDLYLLLHWIRRDELPTFQPYLRSKYRNLPTAARREIEDSFAQIAEKYGYDASAPANGQDES